MATPTYTAIASITLGSSASSVTFSSIPQDYRDLVLVFNGAATTGSQNVDLFLNSDTGSNYSYVTMLGNGSSTASFSASSAPQFRLSTGTDFTTGETSIICQLQDYSATDKHKTILERYNDTADVLAAAARWANTAAVTTLEVKTTSNDFATGSSFALWGIAS